MRIQFFVMSGLYILVALLVILGAFPHKCEGDVSDEECEKLIAKNQHIIIPIVIAWVVVTICIMFYFYNVTRRYKDAFHSA